MASRHIQVLPEGREITVEEGTTLLQAARPANVYRTAIGREKGGCGKCRVVVRKGDGVEEVTR